MPVDWLGTPGFVVQQDTERAAPRSPSLVTKLLGPGLGIEACLAVAADPLPAAWVRVAAIADIDKPQGALFDMLGQVLDYLRDRSVTELGWLAADDWPKSWMPELGFDQVNQIETYLKHDLDLPQVRSIPDLVIRPAQQGDVRTLAEMEAAAFVPLWRHSEEGLGLALVQALSFDVALMGGTIVGFQLSTASGSTAHLVRLTVSTEWHGQGIGSALLAHAITSYRANGLSQVTLNTQLDNIASQFLYRKFGFNATGQRLPVWALPLAQI
jgi:ribosomal protein S18 acetylase RimI-like enzyme